SVHRGEVTMRTLPAMLAELKLRLRAESARMEVRFPYFIERAAPVSGARALMDYESWFIGEANGVSSDFVLGVRVPVTSLCPCSKAISDYGAHNQRGHVTIELRTGLESDGSPAIVWIEELVDVAERSASAPVYPLLKRVDERHVTMQAYDNPAFVEDVVRNVAVQLQADPRVAWFSVHAANEESIHNHSAFARVEWRRAQVAVQEQECQHAALYRSTDACTSLLQTNVVRYPLSDTVAATWRTPVPGEGMAAWWRNEPRRQGDRARARRGRRAGLRP
ncbi:MAG TPA: GTP cyclohydrolase, FolE2/MptA family, partial [Chloroflexota bacterium]|nr:GTP cyclohydrolase, FolE2/MptA family [Chloroflexota bacterium]